MAASWRSNLRDPAGSVPAGVRRILVWGGGSALVLAVAWNSWQRDQQLQAPEEPNPAESQSAPQPEVIDQASRRVQSRAREMDEQERAAALATAQQRLDDQKRRRALQAAVDSHLRDPEGALPPHLALPPGEYAETDVVAEEIRQTEQRRQYESLRAPQIVQALDARAPGGQDGLPAAAGGTPGEEAPAAGDAAGATRIMAALADAMEHPERYPHLYETESPPAPEASRPAPSAGAAAASGPAMLAEPDNPAGWERIYEGEFLECVLLTQLRGDFAGPANAMVAVDMWSRDRQRIVVPRGSRVLGTAAAVARTSQARLALAFHRLIYPGGEWVDLDQFTGLNQLGETGLKDRVNNHYASMFGAAAAIGLLAGLATQGATVNVYGGGVSAEDRARLGVGSSLAEAGMTVMQRFTNRMPTITIRAGHRVRVHFTSDVLVPRAIAGGKGRRQ